MTLTENVLLCKKDMNLDVILNASSIKYDTKLKKNEVTVRSSYVDSK